MGFWMTGGFMAVQGLWASRWMMVLENMDPGRCRRPPDLDQQGLRRWPGLLFMGFFATTLVHRGVKLEKVYVGAMFAALVAFALISLAPGTGGDLLSPVLGICFSLNVP